MFSFKSKFLLYFYFKKWKSWLREKNFLQKQKVSSLKKVNNWWPSGAVNIYFFAIVFNLSQAVISSFFVQLKMQISIYHKINLECAICCRLKTMLKLMNGIFYIFSAKAKVLILKHFFSLKIMYILHSSLIN